MPEILIRLSDITLLELFAFNNYLFRPLGGGYFGDLPHESCC